MAMRTLAILLVALAGAAEAKPHFGGGGGMGGMPPMMMQRRADSGFGPRHGDQAFGPRRGEDGYPPPPPRRAEQDYARDAMRSGANRPLRDIAGQWRGAMPGYDFIGSEFDPGSGGYRLKFMREGSVVWLDVDGRGRELRRAGH